MFYGRQQQLEQLNRLLRKQVSSLVTRRGRRRVGKSTLIEGFAADCGARFLKLEGVNILVLTILSAFLGLSAVAASEVNVLSFGAKADGQTDCTAAFQRAIDALRPQGGKVIVPAGVYVTGDLALLGDVDDLPKDAPTPSQIVHGVGLFNASHGVDEGYPLVDLCLIRGFSGDGIHLHKGFCGNVRNCL